MVLNIRDTTIGISFCDSYHIVLEQIFVSSLPSFQTLSHHHPFFTDTSIELFPNDSQKDLAHASDQASKPNFGSPVDPDTPEPDITNVLFMLLILLSI